MPRLESAKDKQALVDEQIESAKKLKPTNGMVPSVFEFTSLDGDTFICVNYQPEGTQIGHAFHIDHGVGIAKNTDGTVLWLMESERSEST